MSLTSRYSNLSQNRRHLGRHNIVNYGCAFWNEIVFGKIILILTLMATVYITHDQNRKDSTEIQKIILHIEKKRMSVYRNKAILHELLQIGKWTAGKGHGVCVWQWTETKAVIHSFILSFVLKDPQRLFPCDCRTSWPIHSRRSSPDPPCQWDHNAQGLQSCHDWERCDATAAQLSLQVQWPCPTCLLAS